MHKIKPESRERLRRLTDKLKQRAKDRKNQPPLPKRCELCLADETAKKQLVGKLCPYCRKLALKVYANTDDALKIVLWAVRRARMFDTRQRITESILGGMVTGLVSGLMGNLAAGVRVPIVDPTALAKDEPIPYRPTESAK